PAGPAHLRCVLACVPHISIASYAKHAQAAVGVVGGLQAGDAGPAQVGPTIPGAARYGLKIMVDVARGARDEHFQGVVLVFSHSLAATGKNSAQVSAPAAPIGQAAIWNIRRYLRVIPEV